MNYMIINHTSNCIKSMDDH